MKKMHWVAMLPFYLLITIFAIAIATGSSRSVTVLGEKSPVPRQHTVIIDAGHGGVDGGATSCTGVLESKINLEIALRLEAMLQLLGYDTVMIRTEDVSIYTQGSTIAAKKVSDLRERVRIVNETDNAILVSIHQNTYPDSRYGGPQVFYKDVADSKSLAKALQENMNQSLNPASRRVAKPSKSVYLLEHIEKTGVLVECGFLSNPQEDKLLQEAEYQKKVSAVIATALGQFFSGT